MKDKEEVVKSSAAWPVVLLYPQYNQIDVIQGLDVNDMIAVHLAEMFPEYDDLDIQGENGTVSGASASGSVSGASGSGSDLAVPWDRDREYQVSQLAVYVRLEAAPRIRTLQQWLESCREQSALRGELGVESSESSSVIARKRTEEHELKLSQFNKNKKDISSQKLNGNLEKNNSSSSSSGISKIDNNNNNTDFDFDRVGYLDVHLGCTFAAVLTCPGHVLAGGLLTLLVFVRGNNAHKKFLRDVANNGHGIYPLNP